MFIKLRSRAFPALALALSSTWAAVVICPLFYSMLFPTQDIEKIIRALEGQETLPEALKALTQVTRNRSGQLKRAIPVSASYGTSFEYEPGQLHTTKQTGLSYLAWFEKRQKPTILVIQRTEIDGSQIRFDLNEGRPIVTFLFYFLTVVPLLGSAYWFRNCRSLPSSEPIASQR
jgi:hypothetical protein